MKIVDKLCERLRLVADHDTVHAELSQQWLDDPFPLSPWYTWTLLCLVWHRERQQFVADTIRFRLNADLQLLATAGACGHPPGPQHGVVPGQSDWEYYFHGIGCCLTHRKTGEAIDVDFFDQSADWFDPFFFINYLQSLKSPAFVEARVISLHPSFRPVRLSFDHLERIGLLEQKDGRGPSRLAFEHTEIATLLDRIEQRWGDPGCQQLMAIALGDWLMLESMKSGESDHPLFVSKADSLRQKYVDQLVADFRPENYRTETLSALCDLKSPVLDGLIANILAGPVNGSTSTVLDILDKTNDGRWDQQVEALMMRIDPNGDIPSPYCWLKCAGLLVRRGRLKDIRKGLLNLKSAVLGEATLLALEHLPDIAIQLFRRALRSGIPTNRATAAAVLAIIDLPWSRAELAAALSESNDQRNSAECRSAMMETNSVECHRLVQEWEQRNPREPEKGPWISMSELALRHSDGWIRWEMSRLHELVIPLKTTKVTCPAFGQRLKAFINNLFKWFR